LAFSLLWGHFDPKFQVEGVAPTNHFSCFQNQDKRSFIWYKNEDTNFFRFVTNCAFNKQTDSFLVTRPRCMQSVSSRVARSPEFSGAPVFQPSSPISRKKAVREMKSTGFQG